MNKMILVIVAMALIGIPAAASLAQQSQPMAPSQSPSMSQSPTTMPPPSAPQPSTTSQSPATSQMPATGNDQPGASSQARTIDCPPAAAGQPRQTAVGTPQGAGTGSGLNAMPSVGAPQRLEGTIKTIGSTRTNRILEVGNVKLEVEPDTVILVGCREASVTQLKEGSQIKASYQVKEPNRNVATVIEAQQ